MLWENLPYPAQNILEWLVHVGTGKLVTLELKVGAPAPYSKVVVTPDLLSLIRQFAEQDAQDYEILEFTDTTARLRLKKPFPCAVFSR